MQIYVNIISFVIVKNKVYFLLGQLKFQQYVSTITSSCIRINIQIVNNMYKGSKHIFVILFNWLNMYKFEML